MCMCVYVYMCIYIYDSVSVKKNIWEKRESASSRSCLSLFIPGPSCPRHSDQAPAKKMAEQGQALRAELQCAPGAVLHSSTQSVVKGSLKNASRQYKRAVMRFSMSLNLS